MRYMRYAALFILLSITGNIHAAAEQPQGLLSSLWQSTQSCVDKIMRDCFFECETQPGLIGTSGVLHLQHAHFTRKRAMSAPILMRQEMVRDGKLIGCIADPKDVDVVSYEKHSRVCCCLKQYTLRMVYQLRDSHLKPEQVIARREQHNEPMHGLTIDVASTPKPLKPKTP